MRSKKELCRSWKLYVITDKPAGGLTLEEAVAEAVAGGASVVQLRDKHSSDADLVARTMALKRITAAAGIPLLVNDRPKVARAAGADGVHLGQEDGSLEAARAILGAEAIYGRSTHSPQQALEAEKEGFDYIGVGPVFSTPTKPDVAPVGLELVRFAAANVRIPFVAIGGIDAANVRRVREAGATTIAVVRAVMAAPSPRGAAQLLLGDLA